jgi:hypothetical protein
VALGHLDGAVSVVLLDFVHEQESHVLVVDVEDQVWSTAEDSLGQLNVHHLTNATAWSRMLTRSLCHSIGQLESTYILKDIVSLAHIALVDQVQWVPLEVDIFILSFGLSIGMELLVLHQINVEVNSRLEALLLHPVAAITVELNCIIADAAQVLNDLRANQIGLSRVGQQTY